MFKPLKWEDIGTLDVSVYLIEAAVENSKLTELSPHHTHLLPNPVLYISVNESDDNLMDRAVVEVAKKFYPNCIVWEEEHDGGGNYLDAIIFGKELFGNGPDYLHPKEVYDKLRDIVYTKEDLFKNLIHSTISKEWKIFANQFQLDVDDKEAYAVFYHFVKTHTTIADFCPQYVLELCYKEILNTLNRRKQDENF